MRNKGIGKNILYKPAEAWAFVAPAVVGTLIFVIIPIFFSFGLSFFEWDLLSAPSFVGFENYKQIFTEPYYLKIFWNTIFYAGCVTLFGIFLPLALAYMVVRKFFGSEGFKVVTLLPYITPMVVAGTVWAWGFDPTSGVVNKLLGLDFKWLYDENLAMLVLIFVSVWKLLGYNMMLFITGFANINLSVIEAAKVDGAGDFTIFRKIIIPLLLPTVAFVSVVTIISSFQVFDLIYMMTQGGPNSATEVIVYSVYKEGFEYFEAGKSCALGYITFLIILLASGVLMCFNKGKNV